MPRLAQRIILACLLLTMSASAPISGQSEPPVTVAAAAAGLIAEYAIRARLVPPGALTSNVEYATVCAPMRACERLLTDVPIPSEVSQSMRRGLKGEVADVHLSQACPPQRGRADCAMADRRPILAIGAGRPYEAGWMFDVGVFAADSVGYDRLIARDHVDVLIVPTREGDGWYIRSVGRAVAGGH